jgi:hypothetical protein
MSNDAIDTVITLLALGSLFLCAAAVVEGWHAARRMYRRRQKARGIVIPFDGDYEFLSEKGLH